MRCLRNAESQLSVHGPSELGMRCRNIAALPACRSTHWKCSESSVILQRRGGNDLGERRQCDLRRRLGAPQSELRRRCHCGDLLQTLAARRLQRRQPRLGAQTTKLPHCLEQCPEALRQGRLVDVLQPLDPCPPPTDWSRFSDGEVHHHMANFGHDPRHAVRDLNHRQLDFLQQVVQPLPQVEHGDITADAGQGLVVPEHGQELDNIVELLENVEVHLLHISPLFASEMLLQAGLVHGHAGVDRVHPLVPKLEP
mmetsp:Transcript_84338/g.243821  ORF Transcript_84338/g.243821 Transcript_84338/m.243821 type:complete len:254 (-) Transcript_84338:935-1696(-)